VKKNETPQAINATWWAGELAAASKTERSRHDEASTSLTAKFPDLGISAFRFWQSLRRGEPKVKF
jgi:hypothetical protein